MNPFEYSHTNKRYYTFDHYVKKAFGEKVVKVGLDGGFTCPNRDGRKGIGGCSFCAGGGAESMAADQKAELQGEKGAENCLLSRGGRALPSLLEQYEQGRARLEKKWGRCPAIAYFQNYSSTYAPLSYLEGLFEEALTFEGVVGLTIGTRPDCLPIEVLDYLSSLNCRTHLTVELGLQTTFDETATAMNRGHSYEEFLESYHRLKERNIKVAVHLINGLPGEDRQMMLENARRVAALVPDFVKIHCLYYRKGSALGEAYLKGQGTIPVMEMEEYVSLVADQLEYMPKETVIERVTGDAARESLLAPLWTTDKKRVVNLLDKTLKERDSYQGKKMEFVQGAQRGG